MFHVKHSNVRHVERKPMQGRKGERHEQKKHSIS
nr:MAG TPA: hypothetical protein [Caudoviricetes sp.]